MEHATVSSSIAVWVWAVTGLQESGHVTARSSHRSRPASSPCRPVARTRKPQPSPDWDLCALERDILCKHVYYINNTSEHDATMCGVRHPGVKPFACSTRHLPFWGVTTVVSDESRQSFSQLIYTYDVSPLMHSVRFIYLPDRFVYSTNRSLQHQLIKIN